MPIPVLVGAAVGVLGFASHYAAKKNNESAQELIADAHRICQKAEADEQKAIEHLEDSLEDFGRLKYGTVQVTIRSAVNILNSFKTEEWGKFDTSVNLPALDSEGIQNIIDSNIKLYNIYDNSIKNATIGVAGATAITLATTASSAIVSAGSLAAVGTAASSAVGAAASAAIMSPVSMIIAPIAVVTGLSALMKSQANLSQARAVVSKARSYREQVETKIFKCQAIERRTSDLSDIIYSANEIAWPIIAYFNVLISKIKKNKTNKYIDKSNLTKSDIELLILLAHLVQLIDNAFNIVVSEDKTDNDVEEVKNSQELIALSYNNRATASKDIHAQDDNEKNNFLEFKQNFEDGVFATEDSVARELLDDAIENNNYNNCLRFLRSRKASNFSLGLKFGSISGDNFFVKAIKTILLVMMYTPLILLAIVIIIDCKLVKKNIKNLNKFRIALSFIAGYLMYPIVLIYNEYYVFYLVVTILTFFVCVYTSNNNSLSIKEECFRFGALIYLLGLIISGITFILLFFFSEETALIISMVILFFVGGGAFYVRK